MNKFSLDNLDKSTWEPYKFQEIAERISITVDPTTTELEIYVGLEHIDAEDIHIRRFGKPSDVKGNKLKCFKGDVIFGKRRAYQRKAAIVEFDGICSAHSFVFRAKPNIIEPKLFPFFLHSDQFMHRAVDISVGGLSPTINWGDLKDEEFLLPPKEEQKKLAELLWAMDDVIEKEKSLLEHVYNFKNSQLDLTFRNNNNKDVTKLSKICKITSGGTAPQGEEFFHDGNFPFVRMQHLNNLKQNKYPTKYDLINETGVKKSRLKLFERGSILLAKSGESIRSEKKAILQEPSYIVNHLAILHEFNNEYLMEFIFYFFQKFKLSSLISQTTTPSISLADIGNIKIPSVKMTEQEETIAILSKIDYSIELVSDKVSTSHNLQKSLINQIF